jgi:hypothetical protein
MDHLSKDDQQILAEIFERIESSLRAEALEQKE